MELDGLPSTVMPSPAVTLIFDLLTQKFNQHDSTRMYIIKSPDFGKIISNSYEDIVVTRLFGSLPDVTSTFDLFTPNLFTLRAMNIIRTEYYIHSL